MAHFVLCERDFQSWIADMLRDNAVGDSLEFRPNIDERVDALVKRCGSLAALQAELVLAQAETANLLTSLPERFTTRRKHLYRRVAGWVLEDTAGHFGNEHLEQFQRTVAAARAS